MDYESLLNREQLLPVTDTEGAVLVLAGAGSGKTRVLTHRIAYLIEKKEVDPYRILAITFTNKAAGEMRERVRALTGHSGVLIATFHSLCARILRSDIRFLEGYGENFSIYDDSDAQRIITRILKAMGVEDTKELKKDIRWHISNAKNHGLPPEEYESRLRGVANGVIIAEAYKAYEQELRRNNALDFDDLLLKTIMLFSKHRDVLDKYRQRFRYIHVDEFQDTNKIQYMLVRMLGSEHGNVFVVGDDDQSIYGWRWAEAANIRRFKDDYAGCKVYKLEQNYRSTGNILDLANTIIANNTERMGKNLWTAGDKGVKVVYQHSYDDRAEADFVMGQMDSLMRRNGYRYGDFAVLVRAGSITRVFEEKLRLYNFPYRVIGGNKFYDRKEVKDFLAYLKLLDNERDSESVMRVINVPRRGIGDGTIEKLAAASAARGMSLLEGALRVGELDLGTAAVRNIAKFSETVQELIAVKDLPLSEFIDRARAIINFDQIYQKSEDDADRIRNIDEFVRSVKEFAHDNEQPTLEAYLQSVSLMTDADNIDETDCVTVATVHGVKGLEFRCVFIVALEEGIFPSMRMDTPDNLQEERRIMYVAITRARERLYLTNAETRYRYGRIERSISSRFLKEGGFIAARKPVEDESPQPKFDYSAVVRNAPGFAAQPPVSKDVSVFREGMRVEHARFGTGVIKRIMGENADIEFEKLGVKTFNLRLAPIKICG